MICNKCNHKLPEDSEFCQYCGDRIEKTVIPPAVEPQAEPIVAAPPAPVEKPFIATTPQSEKPVKTKYCSRCGSPIDNNTKKCAGCGKQYFRGLRFTKFSVTVIVMSLVILSLSALCIFQYINTQAATSDLQAEVSRLEQQVKSKESTIKRLEGEIDDLEDEKRDNQAELSFFRNYAKIVPDDETRKYHKWGCSKLDTSNGFWIFNTSAAEDDYKKCPYCH